MKSIRFTGNIAFYLLFCVSLLLSWFFHRDSVRFDSSNELWSDRAGYYIYLPATFFYQFDARKMPADLDIRTGGGFSLDTLNNKIDTKYTYGVALMQSPFFLAAHLVSLITGFDDENGFSTIYMRMMALAAVVYLVLGLWLLHLFLMRYFPVMVSLTTILLIFAGTNLFYYSLIDGMMSHVFSFFLFALFLFATGKFQETREYKYFLLICLSFSIAFLIRPTNLILGFCFFFWDSTSMAATTGRFRQFFRPRYFVVFLAMLMLIFLPQLAYWKYLSGDWLHFSYRDEGFLNWRHPRIAEVLFSPLNGLIAWTPLVIFMLAGLAIMIFRKKQNCWLIAILFAMVTMICASWKMWYFGCGYGQRSFIEYYALLSVPLGWLMAGLLKNRYFMVKTIGMLMIFLLVYANLRYVFRVYLFDRCYYGSTWDWEHYRRSFERSGVISPVLRVSTFKNDFENLAICPVAKPSQVFTRSGLYSIPSDGKKRETLLYSARLQDFRYPWPKKMEVEVWMLSPGRRTGVASLVCNVTRDGKTVFTDSRKVSELLSSPMVWTPVRKNFIIPDVNDSSLQVNLLIRNPDGAALFADDLSIRFRYTWSR